MDGPTHGERLWVVVYRIAKGSGDPLARPANDPDYNGKNIHVKPDAEVGDVVEIEIYRSSPVNVVGKIVTNSGKKVQNPRSNKLTIRKKNDYTIQYQEHVKNVRKDLPKRP